MTATPPEPEPPRLFSSRIRGVILAVARRLPGDRMLSIWLLVLLVAGSLWLAGPRGQAHLNEVAALHGASPTPVIDWQHRQDSPNPASISTDSLAIASEDANNTSAPAGPTDAPATPPTLKLGPEPTQETTALTPDGLLPDHRILTYYGFPGNANMGVLGQHDKQTVLTKLRDQAAAYEAADPSRPVLVGLEVIASVAQPDPQADGSYLLDIPGEVLDDYAQFARENDILLFLDVQIGRRTVQAEVKGLRPWLELPFVHLALDPEFAMREGEIPGEQIGQIDASDITWTQQYLKNLTQELGVPPKVLIVHQFHDTMIENRDQVTPMAGVQLVIDADGFGPPATKKEAYDVVIAQQRIEYHGIKLFYDQDIPLMTPEEVLDLEPVPNVVIYQ